MGGLFSKLGALISYLCVGTVLAVLVAGLYLRLSNTITDEQISRVAAAWKGVETAVPKPPDPQAQQETDSEQPSYDDREQARDLRARNLELREQSLSSRLDLVRSEQRTLMVDKERHERLKNAFKEQLNSLRDVTLSSGRENVRLIWENIKPKQAKEQMLQMLANQEINEVVAILSAMPIDKRAKIVSEFKTPDETAKLDEMLRLIREGVPEANLIDKTLNQITQ